MVLLLTKITPQYDNDIKFECKDFNMFESCIMKLIYKKQFLYCKNVFRILGKLQILSYFIELCAFPWIVSFQQR